MTTIQCRKCFNLNPDGATTCSRCGAPLGDANAQGFMPEQVFAGRYVLKRRIGEGGMGEVWQAEQSGIGRDVAIKFMHPDLMRHSTAKQRVLSEGKALGKLAHANVVQIFDFFETDTTVALVLELVEGGSVADRLESYGAFSKAEATGLMLGVLKGLHALHASGMIHRDIKPDNVLLGDDGGDMLPKITDLGIAHNQDGTRLTRDGSRLGTPEYMAPEQIKSGTTGVASDIYACGVMLFEMLSGMVPFAGTDYEIQHGHVAGTPGFDKLPKDTPQWLKDIVETALAKEPDARFQSAAEFRKALKLGANAPLTEVPDVIVSEADVAEPDTLRDSTPMQADEPTAETSALVTPAPQVTPVPQQTLTVAVSSSVKKSKLWLVVVVLLIAGGILYFRYSKSETEDAAEEIATGEMETTEKAAERPLVTREMTMVGLEECSKLQEGTLNSVVSVFTTEGKELMLTACDELFVAGPNMQPRRITPFQFTLTRHHLLALDPNNEMNDFLVARSDIDACYLRSGNE